MHHFVTEMCTHVHISVTKWCIVGYDTDAFWDLWEGYPHWMFCLCLSCLYVCLLCNIMENAWTDFREIFRIGRTWLQEHLVTFKGGDSEGAILFHAGLDCITLLKPGAAGFALAECFLCAMVYIGKRTPYGFAVFGFSYKKLIMNLHGVLPIF